MAGSSLSDTRPLGFEFASQLDVFINLPGVARPHEIAKVTVDGGNFHCRLLCKALLHKQERHIVGCQRARASPDERIEIDASREDEGSEYWHA